MPDGVEVEVGKYELFQNDSHLVNVMKNKKNVVAKYYFQRI